MPCPSCDHTMHSFGVPDIFWCPRCGTILHNGRADPPKVIPLLATWVVDTGDFDKWKALLLVAHEIHGIRPDASNV